MESNKRNGQCPLICSSCDNVIAFFCKICDIPLCEICVGKHLNKDHDICKYSERHTCTSYLCSVHKENLNLYCKTCSDPVCLLCASVDHKNDDLIELAKVIAGKKDKIAHDVNILETKIKVELETQIKELKQLIDSVPVLYKRTMNEITQVGNEWQQKLQTIIFAFKKNLQRHEKEHISLLTKQKTELEEKLFSVRKTILNKYDVLCGLSSTLDYSSDVQHFREIPGKLEIIPSKFTPKDIDRDFMDTIGELTELIKVSFPPYLIKDTCENITLSETPNIVNQLKTTFSYVYDVSFSSCTTPAVWVCGNKRLGNSYHIRLFDSTGNEQKSLKTVCSVEYLTETCDGNIFYSDGKNNAIQKLSYISSDVFASTETWCPKGISFTNSRCILSAQVKGNKQGRQCRVVKYKIDGKTDSEFVIANENGKFDGHVFIAENKNGDICVSDEKGQIVFALRTTGKIHFTYSGNISAKTFPRFIPLGVATDCLGNILISDLSNHTVHIINANGDFLCYLLEGQIPFPHGIAIDVYSNIWVSDCRSENITIVKYIDWY